MEKLVSIIIPVYNVEKYLEKCIESMTNQSYKKLEIVLIDDGSTDQSVQICDKYAKKDKRIKVFHLENHGVSYARNYGLDLANGDYIGFVDSDDEIEEDMIQILVEHMEKEHCDISICGVRNLEEQKDKIRKEEKSKIWKLSKKELLYELMYMKHIPTCVWNKLFKKEVIKDIRFNEKRTISEDYEFLFDVIQKNKELRICYDSKKLYNWYSRKNSATKKNVLLNLRDTSQVDQMYLNYVQKCYPKLEGYAIRKCLYTYILHVKKLENESQKADIMNNIKKYETLFLKSNSVRITDKIKYALKYKRNIGKNS